MKYIVMLLFVAMVCVSVYLAYALGREQAKNANLTNTQLSPTVSLLPSSIPNNTSPTPLLSTGTIEGTLIFPSEGIPDQTICAQNTVTKKEVCTDENILISNKKGYRLEVPAGIYEVYAFVTYKEGPTPQTVTKAYYDEFVTCGLKFECKSHKAIPVEVVAGQTVSDINPHDWYNN